MLLYTLNPVTVQCIGYIVNSSFYSVNENNFPNCTKDLFCLIRIISSLITLSTSSLQGSIPYITMCNWFYSIVYLFIFMYIYPFYWPHYIPPPGILSPFVSVKKPCTLYHKHITPSLLTIYTVLVDNIQWSHLDIYSHRYHLLVNISQYYQLLVC